MEDVKKKKYAIVFRCTVPKCSYSSKRLYNLQRHEKTHGKEHWRSKRFPCPCCAYAAATRAHLKRHMGNKHPTEDISNHDLTVLAYEDFETPAEKQMKSSPTEQMKEPTEEPKSTPQSQQKEAPLVLEGPVTVLQLVTPLSPQSRPQPGEVYCNVTLEGEAFRLIPVEFLPVEAATQEL
ncbi:RE1-silencing transcription factor-like [Drosophila novamexicana]|uniref:RE1-silencing transcription factor-like n=1 Tax=Drosophila novamexicana TaxID=47314 RepID=UPI0011E5F63E|nr:RE1-silencing transcription factor-like [Drosophila novamexicana]